MNKVDVVKTILKDYGKYSIIPDSVDENSSSVIEWSEIGTHETPVFKGTDDECFEWLFDRIAKEIVSALEA